MKIKSSYTGLVHYSSYELKPTKRIFLQTFISNNLFQCVHGYFTMIYDLFKFTFLYVKKNSCLEIFKKPKASLSLEVSLFKVIQAVLLC